MKTLHIAQVNIARMWAFTFKNPFPADEQVVRETDWSSFEPCPAA
jgi:hypothetical protein